MKLRSSISSSLHRLPNETITTRLPALTENGGRVNRVGWTRKELVGSIAKFGFFTEFTQESFDFDSDSELYGHLSRE